MKRMLLAILACLCVGFTALGISSCFELETIDIDGYSLYAEDDGTYTLVGVPDEIFQQTTWEIPEKIGDYPISHVGKHVARGLMFSEEVFESFGRIRHIIVPKSIAGIQAEHLDTLKIIQTEVSPSNFYIGGGGYSKTPFWWYSPQEEVSIVDPIEYKYLTEENFVGDLVFITEISHVWVDECTEEAIETATLLFGLGSGELTIPEAYKDLPVTKIGEEAFKDTFYTSITIGNHIEEIGESVFHSSSLEYVSLPESCTEIPNCAFLNSNLKEITIPQSVTKIGEYAFADCELMELVVPASVTEIEEGAFSSNPLIAIDLSACAITELNAYVFRNCLLNGKVLLPNTVTVISCEAFRGTKMTSFNFPSALKEIGSYAFRDVQLQEIRLPNTLESIHDFAFADNLALTELRLPNSCLEFDESAIKGCANLEKLHLGNVEGYEYVDYTCSTLSEITVSNENRELFIQNGMLFRKDLTNVISLLKCPKAVKTSTLILNDCGIASGAMEGHTELTEVQINQSGFEDIDIMGRAFYGCTALEKVTLSNKVKKIRHDAFNGCTSLSQINLGKVEEIHDKAFFGCSSLEKADFTSATAINTSAFEGCNLKEVHTYHVRSIHTRAFANNVNLKKATIEDCGWIGSEAFAGCKKLVTFYAGDADYGSDVFKDTPQAFFRFGCKGKMSI